MVEMARLLIELGANVEAKNDFGETPLDIASKNQQDEITKLLSELRTK